MYIENTYTLSLNHDCLRKPSGFRDKQSAC